MALRARIGIRGLCAQSNRAMFAFAARCLPISAIARARRAIHGHVSGTHHTTVTMLRSSRYAAPSLESIMLSDRQREVTLLAAEGLSNKEIAQRLEISGGTVKVHLQDVYRKLGIRNRTMLATLAASSDIQKTVVAPTP